MSVLPYQLVISDIDGTLLDDDGNLPDLNRRALAHCRERGVATCLATGRRWTTCLRLLERLQLFDVVDYCILNNGMLIQDLHARRAVYRRDFPFDLLLETAARWNGMGLEPVVLGHNPDGNTRDVFHRRDSLLNADFVGKNTAHSLRVEAWEELAGAHLVELVLIGKREDLAAAAGALQGLEVETAILKNTFYAEYMLEVTPRGVSKLSGARALQSHLGSSEGRILAVGDSENDLELLRGADMSVAVANADARVKAVAKEITGFNGEGGFGQAVFRHLPSL